ncbi:MAG: recombinase family protein [Candidatus Cryosericum sp.]
MKKKQPQYVLYLRQRPPRRKAISLDDQQTQAAALVRCNHGVVVATFTEQETGDSHRDRSRTALRAAIDCALGCGGTLVIANVGRLSRNLYFTSPLLETQVPFVCCDMPQANNLTIHVLHALAVRTAKGVSDRSRQVSAELRAAGVPLGSARPGHWDGRERGWRQAVAQASKLRTERAAQQYAFLIPQIKERRERGDTLGEILAWLNDTEHVTTVGKPFTEVAVWRLIKRYLGSEYLGNNLRKAGK